MATTSLTDPTDVRPPPAAAPPSPRPADLVGRLRRSFDSGRTRPMAWRRAQLDGLRRLLVDEEDRLLAALRDDLGKSATEGWMTELRHVVNEISHIERSLSGWVRHERVHVRALLRPARAEIVPEPLGVALVIAPWNYPIHLLLLPMAYALAAGNAVVGKPSEISARTSAALAELVPRYLDPEAVAIVEGDAPLVTALLEQRFDHVFYTGNGTVGRVVMEAAARHLTPVTLELGGKSPVVVDASANLGVAAKRVAWGKFVNAGQTCVAPDYVMVDRRVEAPFLAALAEAVRDLYGSDATTSEDYGRIVSDRHFGRVTGLLAASPGATRVTGGQSDAAARYVAPTVLSGVGWDDAVMGEEIFGPLLPVLAYDGLDEAIATINGRDKPLALYVFAEDRAVAERIVAETSSGGVGVNVTLLHLAVPDLPFGGVGASGMGAYHGKAGFDTFSHRKSVLRRPTRPDPSALYPPYGGLKRWLLRKAF